jgi:cytochrome c biogenesis protein CcmG/thiol:disulfide interchange protein DsbE
MDNESMVQVSPPAGNGLIAGRGPSNLRGSSRGARARTWPFAVGGVVLLACAAVLLAVLALRSRTLDVGPAPTLAATVDGIPVTMAEYRTQLTIALATYGDTPSAAAAQGVSQLVADRAMQQAIDDVLIDEAARRHGVSVSDPAVAGAIARMVESLESSLGGASSRGSSPVPAADIRSVAAHAVLRQALDRILHGSAWLDDLVANADVRYFVGDSSAAGATPALVLGRRAPPFVATDLRGRSVSLTALHGKAVVLNFWTTWSGYSRSDLPLLLEFTRLHPNLYVVALDHTEGVATVRDFVQVHRLEGLTVWLDSSGTAYSRYGMNGIPATFFIDMHGILRSYNFGALPGVSSLDYQTRFALRGLNNTDLSQNQ